MAEPKEFPPVYRESWSYAKENGEEEAYRISRRENIRCKKAIDESIGKHYDGNYLDSAAVKEVFEEYGRDRTMHVLAVTVQEKDWDGRFSSSNRAWANSFSIPADIGSFKDDRRLEYVLNSHSVLINAFIDDARKEPERKISAVISPEQQNKEAPARDKPSVLGKLKSFSPKTPDGHKKEHVREER